MARSYDVAILGGTAAGWAAAARLARAGAEVVLVDSPIPPSESPLCDWAPGDFFTREGMPRSLAAAAKAVAFRSVRYYSADLTQTAEYSAGRSRAGYFLRSADLIRALQAVARKLGVKARTTRTPPAIQLGEDSVRLLGTTQVVARILLVAHSRPAEVLASLALPVRTGSRAACIVGGLDVPAGGQAPVKKLGKCLHVVASRQRGLLGMFFLAGKALHCRMICDTPAGGAPAGALSGMIASLQQADILPPDLPLARATGAIWSPPVAEALDLGTHVAKRCLLAGTAGGFVDTLSAHTLTPTVRSALIAADVAANSLAADAPQEALMAFMDQWRKSLADTIRPPSTARHLLLPLLFANKRLVTRFSKALLYGQGI